MDNQKNSSNGKKSWDTYPIGTKAHSCTGGYWIKIQRGWKWCTGSTFPTPGADVSRIELPVDPPKD